MQESNAVSFEQVLRTELDEIAESRQRRRPGRANSTQGDVYECARKAQLVGLAFSGGGIRSATFNLGVIQGLARLRLLPMFDYLSTVSGGGYIGGWFCSWVKRATAETPGRGLRSVIECLMPGWRAKRRGREPSEVHFLRRYSNYLTPRLGALSADTWTLATTYARNLVLNLAILVTFLGAALLVPRVGVWLFQAALGWIKAVGTDDILLLAFVLLLAAFLVISTNLSTPTDDGRSEDATPRWYERSLTIHVIAPLLLVPTAYLMSAGLWVLADKAGDPDRWLSWAFTFGFLYALMWVACCAVAFVRALSARNVSSHGTDRQDFRTRLRAAPRRVWNWSAMQPVGVIVAAFPAGMVAGVLFLAVAAVMQPWVNAGSSLWLAACFGMPLVALAFATVAVVHVGLAGRAFRDEAREWWSRLGAVFLLWVGVITVVALLAVYGPLGVYGLLPNYGPPGVNLFWQSLPDWLRQWIAGVIVSGWLATTIAGMLLGNKGPRESAQESLGRRVVVTLAPYVFVLGLLLLLAWGLNAWLARQETADYWSAMDASLGANLLYYVVGLLALSVFLSWRIGINDFSLHAGYRDRLVRCYLGASNRDRCPSPFTGIDPQDNAIYLSELTVKHDYHGPYPIINTALNLVRGDDLAWQTRKAASFVFTPHYSGYDYTQGRRPDSTLGDRAYRPTESYGDGVRLGTAMAISGAAASPNMGFHSSAPLAFLMTMFNVRLGWWLGNPRHPATWTDNGPRVGLFCLLCELFGLTNDRRRYIYLSDGGHFENLGVYELVRRRCRYILACDAGEDHKMEFGDLGSAVEKIRADFGIDVELNYRGIRPSEIGGLSRVHCAVGRIRYDLYDGSEPGILLYVKSSVTGEEPADIAAYRAQHGEFPHESTADQWFDEAQFESYRALGEHVIQTVLCDAEEMKQPTAERVFQAAAKLWRAKPVTQPEGKRK